MDAAHFHLILNHFPIAGFVFAIPLLIAAGLLRSETLGRIGLILVLTAGLVTIPTFLTGEPAEELIEHLPGISEQVIKVHEEAAEKAVWAIGAAALAALVALILALKRKGLPKWAIPLVTLLSVFAAVLLGWTNNLGGQISHPEIRKGATASAQPGETRSGEGKEDED